MKVPALTCNGAPEEAPGFKVSFISAELHQISPTSEVILVSTSSTNLINSLRAVASRPPVYLTLNISGFDLQQISISNSPARIFHHPFFTIHSIRPTLPILKLSTALTTHSLLDDGYYPFTLSVMSTTSYDYRY